MATERIAIRTSRYLNVRYPNAALTRCAPRRIMPQARRLRNSTGENVARNATTSNPSSSAVL